jgi:hypothetical protein
MQRAKESAAEIMRKKQAAGKETLSNRTAWSTRDEPFAVNGVGNSDNFKS